MSVHTIWVPAGWSVEQAWEAIKRGERVPWTFGAPGFWINVDEHGKPL